MEHLASLGPSFPLFAPPSLILTLLPCKHEDKMVITVLTVEESRWETLGTSSSKLKLKMTISLGNSVMLL